MKTKKEVLSLLVALGPTAKKVANKLVSLGIKGERNQCKTCPIAQYLFDNGVGEWIEIAVGGGGMDIYMGWQVGGYPYHLSNYPQLIGVHDFIFAFDRGEFPQCEGSI